MPTSTTYYQNWVTKKSSNIWGCLEGLSGNSDGERVGYCMTNCEAIHSAVGLNGCGRIRPMVVTVVSQPRIHALISVVAMQLPIFQAPLPNGMVWFINLFAISCDKTNNQKKIFKMSNARKVYMYLTSLLYISIHHTCMHAYK